MDNKSSLLLRPEEIAKIQEETDFTPKQDERLHSRFTSWIVVTVVLCHEMISCVFPNWPLIHCVNVLCMSLLTIAPMTAIISVDLSMSWIISEQLKLNRKQTNNSREDKLKFALNIFDLDDDGVFSRVELVSILHMMVDANISQD